MKTLFAGYFGSGNSFSYSVEHDLDVAGFLINDAKNVSLNSELESRNVFSNITTKQLNNSNVAPNNRLFKLKETFKKGDTIFGLFDCAHPDRYCSCILVEQKDVKNGFNFSKNKTGFKTAENKRL